MSMNENISAEGFRSDRVNVGRSAVRSLSATSADVQQSAVQKLSAETVKATDSALGLVNGATLELRDSAVGLAAGDYIRVEDSTVLVLVAPRVSGGNVKALVTWPAALAFGAGIFLARAGLKALASRRTS
jgi:hypothetical protein